MYNATLQNTHTHTHSHGSTDAIAVNIHLFRSYTSSLVPALVEVWQKYMTSDDEQHVQILAGLNASCEIDTIIADNELEWCYTGSVLYNFQRAIFLFLLVQNQLGAYFPSIGIKLFDVTIKSHALAHVAFQAAFLNPCLTWCWSGEDFMSKVKLVTQNQVNGASAKLVTYNVANAYCSGMHFELTPAENWWSHPEGSCIINCTTHAFCRCACSCVSADVHMGVSANVYVSCQIEGMMCLRRYADQC